MNDDTLIQDKPLPIKMETINDQLVQTIDARKLHEFLEVGKDFSNWIKGRIDQYEFVENQDFVCSPKLGSKDRGGQNRKEYHLNITMAKEMAMVERNEKGKQARRYFIKCERRLKEKMKPKSQAYQLLETARVIVAHEEHLQLLQQTQNNQQKQIDDIAQRQDNIDGNTGYMTALAFCRQKKILAPINFSYELGKETTKKCKKFNIHMGKISDERFGTVNSYPVEVLDECLADLIPPDMSKKAKRPTYSEFLMRGGHTSNYSSRYPGVSGNCN